MNYENFCIERNNLFVFERQFVIIITQNQTEAVLNGNTRFNFIGPVYEWQPKQRFCDSNDKYNKRLYFDVLDRI